jgi:hypothetical protein
MRVRDKAQTIVANQILTSLYINAHFIYCAISLKIQINILLDFFFQFNIFVVWKFAIIQHNHFSYFVRGFESNLVGHICRIIGAWGGIKGTQF